MKHHHFTIPDLYVSELKSRGTDYWAIENKVHYIADFVFGEDRSTIRAKNGPRVMSALSAFAMNVMRACGIGNLKRCVANLQNAPQNFFAKAA